MHDRAEGRIKASALVWWTWQLLKVVPLNRNAVVSLWKPCTGETPVRDSSTFSSFRMSTCRAGSSSTAHTETNGQTKNSSSDQMTHWLNAQCRRRRVTHGARANQFNRYTALLSLEHEHSLYPDNYNRWPGALFNHSPDSTQNAKETCRLKKAIVDKSVFFCFKKNGKNNTSPFADARAKGARLYWAIRSTGTRPIIPTVQKLSEG